MKFKLSEITAELDIKAESIIATNNIEFDRAFFDSRQCTEGSIFIALDGENTKGFKFINNAVQNGAKAVVVEYKYINEISPIDDITYFFVENALEAFNEIARISANKFSGEIIGVIGSVGKTTTKDIITELSSASVKTFSNEKSFNNETGVPYTLCSLPQETDRFILEMGETHFGDLEHLTSIVKPDCVVVTNVGLAHIEFLGSLKGVAKTMNEVIRNLGPDHKVVLPQNIEHKEIVLDATQAQVIEVSFERENKATYWLEDVTLNPDLTSSIAFASKDLVKEIEIPLQGKHFTENIALAIATCLALGDDMNKIVSHVSKLKTQGHRMRVVKADHLVILDDCYNANPTSMKANIDALADYGELNKLSTILFMGPMRELGESSDAYHIETVQYALDKKLDKIILVGEENSEAYNILKQYDNLYFYKGVDDALSELQEKLEPNAVVSVKASRGPNPDRPYLFPIVEKLEKLSFEEKIA